LAIRFSAPSALANLASMVYTPAYGRMVLDRQNLSAANNRVTVSNVERNEKT
jgi:hypothetical protein